MPGTGCFAAFCQGHLPGDRSQKDLLQPFGFERCDRRFAAKSSNLGGNERLTFCGLSSKKEIAEKKLKYAMDGEIKMHSPAASALLQPRQSSETKELNSKDAKENMAC